MKIVFINFCVRQVFSCRQMYLSCKIQVTILKKYIIYTVYGKRKAPAANAADAKGKTDLISTEELQLLHAFFRSCQPAELQQHRL